MSNNIQIKNRFKNKTSEEFKGSNYRMCFGKHAGELLGDIVSTNPGYIIWLCENKILKVSPSLVDLAYKNLEEFEYNHIDKMDLYDEVNWGDRD